MLLFPVARRPCVGKERISYCNSGAFILFEFTSNCAASPSAYDFAKDSRPTPTEEEKSRLPIEALCQKSRVNKSNELSGWTRSREGGGGGGEDRGLVYYLEN